MSLDFDRFHSLLVNRPLLPTSPRVLLVTSTVAPRSFWVHNLFIIDNQPENKSMVIACTIVPATVSGLYGFLLTTKFQGTPMGHHIVVW